MMGIRKWFMLISTTSLLVGAVCYSPPAQAGRYVLNQPVETINRYFGLPLSETSQSQEGQTQIIRTYRNAGIRRVLPQFPREGRFQITFVEGKARTVSLAPGPDAVGFGSGFTYGREEASRFFNYIFGYQSPLYQAIPGYYGGGHEGFFESVICLGDGVATGYAEGNPGVLSLMLYYEPICEPPYRFNPLDLSGRDLRGAHYGYQYHFDGVSFIGADFSQADLRNASFNDANLQEANLSQVDLQGTSLRNANLTHANLTGAVLDGADLSGVNLSGADLQGIHWNELTQWTGVQGWESVLHAPQVLQQQLGF